MAHRSGGRPRADRSDILSANHGADLLGGDARNAFGVFTVRSVGEDASALGALLLWLDRARGTGESATPFDLYLDALTSREVATQLAKDKRVMTTIFSSEWDKAGGRWHEPANPLRSPGLALKSLVGRSDPWSPPDAARLQDYLKRKLQITKGTKEAISKIVYRHADPVFATYLLRQLDKYADAKTRRAALQQATRYAAYLSRRLPTIAVAEHRAALIETLAEQERAVMMTSADTPYAATVLETPTSSAKPTSPQVLYTLLGAAFGALFIGCVLAAPNISDIRTRFREDLPENDRPDEPILSNGGPRVTS